MFAVLWLFAFIFFCGEICTQPILPDSPRPLLTPTLFVNVTFDGNDLVDRSKRQGVPAIVGAGVLGCAGNVATDVVNHLATDQGTWKNIPWRHEVLSCVEGAALGASVASVPWLAEAVGTPVVAGAKAVGNAAWNWLSRGKRQTCRRKRDAFNCDLAALAFHQMDASGDAKLDLSELLRSAPASRSDAEEFHRFRDVDGSGFLEPREIHPCLIGYQGPSSVRIKRCDARVRRSTNKISYSVSL